MTVFNIPGTAEIKCGCGSWLQHWKNHSSDHAVFCRAKGCTNTADVGAHVMRTGEDNNLYIVPFCNSHFNASGNLALEENTRLVEANESIKC